MREQLRQIIVATRGPSAWDELIKTEGDIRKRRQAAVYEQKERQQKFIEITAIIGAVCLLGTLIVGLIWFVGRARGLW